MVTDTPNYCPYCGVSLRGKKIPEKDLHYYHDATHYSRCISVYSRECDSTTHWKCPDCERMWVR